MAIKSIGVCPMKMHLEYRRNMNSVTEGDENNITLLKLDGLRSFYAYTELMYYSVFFFRYK